MYYKLLPFIVLFFLASCTAGNTYERHFFIKNSTWQYKDVKQFKVTITDTSKAYDMLFLLQHGYEYKYSNIIIKIATTYPSGAKDTTNPLEIPLAPPDGRWLGTTAGKQVIHNINIGPNGAPLKFKEKGTYVFAVEQVMRDAALLNVNKIGLKLMGHHVVKMP